MSAREAAWNILRQWKVEGAPPLVPERGEGNVQWEKLLPRDRAFAFDVVTGVMRWRGLLDAVIGSRLRGPLEQLDAGVRAILWLGAYQLLIQGGTADYAAVDTSVALAKKFAGTSKAAGLVNAVLRGITRLQPRRKHVAGHSPPTLSRRTFALDFSTEVSFAEDVFSDPVREWTKHLAATRSHPAGYVAHLRGLFDEATVAAILLRNNQRPAITLRDDSRVTVPAESGLIVHPEAADFFVAASGWNATIEGMVRSGALSPQDVTAAKPVRRLVEMLGAGVLAAPRRVLDLCAGLGTKTMQLARAFPEARVVAADVDAPKLARLVERAKTIGLTNVDVLTLSGHTDGGVAGGPFDVVVVDAPCSNTGVMAKRIQSRWRWPSLDHGALHGLQSRLLEQAGRSVAVGGTVLFSTCSIDPAENQGRIAGLTGSHEVLAEERTLPSLGDSTGPHDGGYYAVVRRRD